jgi:acetyltransferase-like isoleucine patch superfamily enzyme
MKTVLARRLKHGSLARWLLAGFYRNPVRFSVSLYRSLIATKKLTGSLYPLRVRIQSGQSLRIRLGNKVDVTLIGNLEINSWDGTDTTSSISCSNESKLAIHGNFDIGPNCHIQLAHGAKLTLGGSKVQGGSGITGNSRIMVEDFISIGCDCIIAWDVFISDSDWHNIFGIARCSPTLIGDHVWISHGVSVLKGSVIPSGCIVGAKSLVRNAFDTENALIAGIPARVIKDDVEWSR